MTRLIGPAVIAAATGVADAGSRLIEQQPVGIGTAITIATFVGTACLWLDSQFRKRDVERAIQDGKVCSRLTKIEQQIADLDCNKCPKKP